MTLVPYSCCHKQFEDFYSQQGQGLPYYQGVPFQRGYGIGGFFRRLFRTALPFIVRGAKTVGKEALRTGTEIAGDLLEGKSIKRAAKERTITAGKKLATSALTKAQEMFRKERKASKHISLSKRSRKKRRDIFDA